MVPPAYRSVIQEAHLEQVPDPLGKQRMLEDELARLNSEKKEKPTTVLIWFKAIV